MRWRVKYRLHLGVTFAPSVLLPEILIMSHSFDSGHPDSSLEDSAKGSDTFSSPFPFSSWRDNASNSKNSRKHFTRTYYMLSLGCATFD